jgi:UDP-2,3-diacylglucosamine pyrophosphatase LpxH
MHHLFISDVHLGAFDKNKDQQLEGDIISLIDYCESHKIHLHVLGDLFDYWMEFPNYIPPLGNNILKRFKNYHANIGHTYYITGNHDCWTIGAFKKNGFIVRKNEAIFTFDRHSVFLMHGDGVENKTYNMPRPLLNKILRHPWFVASFQYFLSGKRANSLMKWFSDFTRDPADENPEKLNGWARNLITDHNFDVVIFGHDHIARTETFSKGIYINCGAFHKNNTLAEYKNNEFNLVTWNSHLNRLHPF